MYVDSYLFDIKVRALKRDRDSYVIEVSAHGRKDVHYAVGPQNSLPNLIGRICAEMQAKLRVKPDIKPVQKTETPET